MKYALLIYAASTDRTPEPRLGEGVIDNWRGGLAVGRQRAPAPADTGSGPALAPATGPR